MIRVAWNVLRERFRRKGKNAKRRFNTNYTKVFGVVPAPKAGEFKMRFVLRSLRILGSQLGEPKVGGPVFCREIPVMGSGCFFVLDVAFMLAHDVKAVIIPIFSHE